MIAHKARHAWLRDALMDRGKLQKDVAKAWGCDEAVVSRFIRTGDPELTFQRAEVLAKMLGIDLMELQTRLAEKPVPASRKEPARGGTASVATRHEPNSVLAELKETVARAREALPGWRITLTIEANGENAGA